MIKILSCLALLGCASFTAADVYACDKGKDGQCDCAKDGGTCKHGDKECKHKHHKEGETK